MEYKQSFTRNLWNGAVLRLKKILLKEKGRFKINSFHKIYLKHLPAGKTHSGNLLGQKTLFRGGPDYLMGLNEIFVDGNYNQTLPENAFIIDCGSHIGMSIIFFKSICPTARITGFEPDAINYDLLMKNMSSHNLKDIKIINKAVWTSNTTLSFDMEASMSSHIVASETGTKVEACRLSDYLNEEVDFLKIDIEGAEYEVLKDIAPKLKNVAKLFVEYHGTFQQNNELVEMLDILVKNNFRFYIKETGPVYAQPFTGIKGNSLYDLQLNIFCINNNPPAK